MAENWIECRTCGDEFNAEDKETKAIGFYNQCLDCAEEEGDVPMVKGYINTADGDFAGVSIVSAEDFEKIQKIREDTANMGKRRG